MRSGPLCSVLVRYIRSSGSSAVLSSPVQERHRQIEESPEKQQNDGASDIKEENQRRGTAQFLLKRNVISLFLKKASNLSLPIVTRNHRWIGNKTKQQFQTKIITQIKFHVFQLMLWSRMNVNIQKSLKNVEHEDHSSHKNMLLAENDFIIEWSKIIWTSWEKS